MVSVVQVIVDSSTERLDDAALIWAEATAARDGHSHIAALELARPPIAEVVHRPDALLLIAITKTSGSVGFAAAAPICPQAAHFELHYLGVRPDVWGHGVGATLLTALGYELCLRGCRDLKLWVYGDNPRAVALYRRMGSEPLDEARIHPRSGRREQRHRLVITPAE